MGCRQVEELICGNPDVRRHLGGWRRTSRDLANQHKGKSFLLSFLSSHGTAINDIQRNRLTRLLKSKKLLLKLTYFLTCLDNFIKGKLQLRFQIFQIVVGFSLIFQSLQSSSQTFQIVAIETPTDSFYPIWCQSTKKINSDHLLINFKG